MLARANLAVMACVRGGGQPVKLPTWYLLEDDDRILINLDAGRPLEYLRSDPRVSLAVLNGVNSETTVSVQVPAVDLTDDPELVDIDRLATHYLGKRYPERERQTCPRAARRADNSTQFERSVRFGEVFCNTEQVARVNNRRATTQLTSTPAHNSAASSCR